MALFKKNTSGFNFKIPPDNDPWKFVSNPNDPAYKSYSDSLSLYNNSRRQFNQLASTAYGPLDYYKDMSPLDHYRHYERTNVSKNKIQPIGWHEMAGLSSYEDNFVYKKPTNPIFLEGTELANNAKKQIMLKEAGLYKGNIDGIWGNKSIAAMQQYELQQQNSTPVQSTGQTVTPTAQQQNITQSQPTSRVVAPTTQQPTVEAKPVVPKVVSGVSKNYGAYTSTSGKSPNIAESNSFGSSTNTKGYYYTVRYTDGTTETLTPSEYEQSYGSSKNKAFKKTTNL